MSRIGATGFIPIPGLQGAGGLGGQDTAPSDVTSICDIADVDCTYLSDGDTLVWNGYVWVASSASTAGRWELAVIPGSPPDTLYADGDWLYIFVP